MKSFLAEGTLLQINFTAKEMSFLKLYMETNRLAFYELADVILLEINFTVRKYPFEFYMITSRHAKN